MSYNKQYALFVPGWENGVKVGITTRVCGDMGFEQRKSAEKRQNEKLCQKMNARGWFKLVPEHKDNVYVLYCGDSQLSNGENYFRADALISIKSGKRPKICLISPTADCPTVCIHHPEISAIVHSGRKSTGKNIVGKVVNLMKGRGLSPSSLHAAIIPGISCKNYKVSPEIAEKFKKIGFVKGTHIDLKKTIIKQLKATGIEKIGVIPGFCSYESQMNGKLFYSYRATGTRKRNAVFISC